MSKTYSGVYSKKVTPQSEPIPGSNQVKNSAGGYSYQVGDWGRLNRFLILGSEKGSYYASERKLTKENAEVVERLINRDGVKVVQIITEISEEGKAPKNDPAIFALALCASFGDKETKRAAFYNLNRVCRTGTHLFQFTSYVDDMRGWGRSLREGIAGWYISQDVNKLSYQVIKYQQREGWSHRDLLRKCHVKPETNAKEALYKWITSGKYEEGFNLKLIEGFEKIKQAASAREVVSLIQEYKLPRETVPTQFLTEGKVWEALLEEMPMTAMIRNLATMTRVGILGPLSDGQNKVIKELSDQERITKSRVHPITILAALLTYSQGKGVRGTNSWDPQQRIVDALDAAFYKSFGNVEPCGKNILLALDVSGSMTWGDIAGIPGLTPMKASAALALVTANVEQNYHILGFSHKLVPINISPSQRLDDVIRTMENVPMGGTNCSLPMLYAKDNKLKVDGFVTLTDSETNFGYIHPSQALKDYRNSSGRDSKNVVMAMLSNGFSVSDPEDTNSMDCVGFSTDTPQIISNFIAGKI